MSGSEDLRALFVQYDRVHFLLNRAQCVSSLFASKTIEAPSRFRYLRELICVGSSRLLFFDLHRFLCEVYRARTGVGARLAIVSDLSLFGESTRSRLSSEAFPAFESLGVDEGRVAFRIPSSTLMKSLGIGEIAPNNRSIREAMVGRGMLAVHPTEGSMGFLLDLDRLAGTELLAAQDSAEGGAT